MVGIAFSAMLLGGSDAQAQMLQWTDRVFLNVSGGVQTGKTDVATTLSLPLYDETATIGTTREVKGTAIWDVTGGVRVWSNMAVALSVSGRSGDSDGLTTAVIPHPAFYDQSRSVTGGVAGMKHTELWTSVLFGWMMPVTEKFEVMAMLGPTVAAVKHETVVGASVVEGSSPTVTVDLETVDKSVWGVMAGVDGRYLVTKNIGVGVFARYAKATVNLTSTTKLPVGGLQVGAGVRIKF
ncbi:MAG: hypothetical protein EXQ49_10505 [Acidobacteria bacterium]|nr:hypothetical protein [Acidobacteriota bacterium]